MDVTHSHPSEQTDPEWVRFIRVLDRDERDVDGKLLRRGTKVLYHPSHPQAFREDNPANRQEFLRRDRTWTPEARQHLWFPPLSSIPMDFADRAQAGRVARKAFMAAVGENMISAVGRPIPEVQSLPLWFSLLAWEPIIRDVVEVADLSEPLAARMMQTGGVPTEVVWPSEWRPQLTDLNVIKVYALRGMTVTVYAVVAFATPIRFQCGGLPEFQPLTPGTADIVQDVAQRWAFDHRANEAAFTFFTIGSASPWPEQMTGQAASDHWVVLSSLQADGTWQTRTPPRFADRLSLRDFLDRLRPVTPQQRISQIKLYVDGLLNSGYEGNIHLEKIAKETGFRRTAVCDALMAMQESGHYQLYRTSSGLMAVGPQAAAMGIPVTVPRPRRRWLRRIAFLGPAIGLTIWVMRDVIIGKPVELQTFVVSVPLAYCGEWLNTRFGRWRQSKE
jgi:hypothetical protein